MEIDSFSIFSCFWAKLAVLDRVSRAVVTVDGAGEFETVADDVGDAEMANFWDISLVLAPVVSIIAFFLLSESAIDCDVATQVTLPISKCWGVVASVWVPKVAIKVAETGIGGLMMWQLVWVLTKLV